MFRLANRESEFYDRIQQNKMFFIASPESITHRIEMAPNLLELSDKILVNIFIDFTVSELSHVAATCTRLRTIARKVFELRCAPECLDIKMNIWNMDYRPEDVSNYITDYRRAAAILQSFGDLIANLDVTFCRSDVCSSKALNTGIFNLIMMTCTGEHLETIGLNGFEAFEPNKLMDAAAFFQNVKELRVTSSTIIDDVLSFDPKQLTKLTLASLELPDAVKVLTHDFPQLQSLTVDSIKWNKFESEVHIMAFLKRHPNLAELHLHWTHLEDLSSVAELLNLRKLTIFPLHASLVELEPIAKLDKLTELALTSDKLGRKSLINFFNTSKSSQSIESLFLTASFDDDGDILSIMNGLWRFTNLKHFTFYFNHDSRSLFEAFPSLDKLRVLSLNGNQSITDDGLVGLVKRLPRLERLCLISVCNTKFKRLQEATLGRISQIYQTRKQKLLIHNCFYTDAMRIIGAEGKQQEMVRFISNIYDDSDIESENDEDGEDFDSNGYLEPYGYGIESENGEDEVDSNVYLEPYVYDFGHLNYERFDGVDLNEAFYVWSDEED